MQTVFLTSFTSAVAGSFDEVNFSPYFLAQLGVRVRQAKIVRPKRQWKRCNSLLASASRRKQDVEMIACQFVRVKDFPFISRSLSDIRNVDPTPAARTAELDPNCNTFLSNDDKYSN